MSSDYLKQTLLKHDIEAAKKRQAVFDAVDKALASPGSGLEDIEETRDRQVLIRVGEAQRDRWQQCADADGLSVSEWLRQMADARYREVFLCTHPLDQRKSYPWSELCMKCGVRLR